MDNHTVLHKHHAAADYTVGLLLALDRSIVERELQRNEANWRRDVSITPPYRALGLMKVGIVGLDEVARQVIRRLKPFGCRILVYNPEPKEEEILALGCEPASLPDLFRICNAVTLHMRQPAGEPPLIGAELLSLFKPTSWLINITDAYLLDEHALCDAVMEGRMAGVALDVFQKEPLPKDYPLCGLSNVILTPHIAEMTR